MSLFKSTHGLAVCILVLATCFACNRNTTKTGTNEEKLLDKEVSILYNKKAVDAESKKIEAFVKKNTGSWKKPGRAYFIKYHVMGDMPKLRPE